MDKKPKLEKKERFSKKDKKFIDLLTYLFIDWTNVNSQNEDAECYNIAQDFVDQINYNLENPKNQKEINWKKFNDFMKKYNEANYLKNFFSFDTSARYPLINSQYGSLDNALKSWYDYLVKEIMNIFDKVEKESQHEHTIRWSGKSGYIKFKIKPYSSDDTPNFIWRSKNDSSETTKESTQN